MKPGFKNFDSKGNWIIIFGLKNNKLKIRLDHS